MAKRLRAYKKPNKRLWGILIAVGILVVALLLILNGFDWSGQSADIQVSQSSQSTAPSLAGGAPEPTPLSRDLWGLM